MAEPRVVACISGWCDTELLAGAARSVEPFGWPIAYADGAYDLALPAGAPWWTEPLLVAQALSGLEVGTAMLAAGPEPWSSEAAKKTALLAFARRCFPRAEWALFLDTDERLEPQAWGVDATLAALALHLDAGLSWATVNLYRPDYAHALEGFPLPRLIRLQGELEFRPPMDFDVYRDGRRIAYLDGEPVPVEQSAEWVEIPTDCLRIRHDRRLRPAERHGLMGRYAVKRRWTLTGQPW